MVLARRRSGADPRLRPRLAAQAAPDPAAVSRDRDLQRPASSATRPSHWGWPGYGSSSGRSHPGNRSHTCRHDRRGADGDVAPTEARDDSPRLLPGALLVAVGAQLIQIAVLFYFAPRLGRSEETYGALGTAATLLIWLYVISRLFTGAAFLNSTLWLRRNEANRQPRRIPTRESSPPLRLVAAVALVARHGVRSAAPRRRGRARGAHAPIVRLVEQAEECGQGAVRADRRGQPLRRADVALRGPWNPDDLVKIAPDGRPRAGLYGYHLDFPGNALEPGLRLRALGTSADRGKRADHLRPCGDRSRSPREARASVLALLRLQRLEQPARGRLGERPARLRRRRCREALGREPVRSGTASTREPRARLG